jgi:hypothetical protein
MRLKKFFSGFEPGFSGSSLPKRVVIIDSSLMGERGGRQRISGSGDFASWRVSRPLKRTCSRVGEFVLPQPSGKEESTGRVGRLVSGPAPFRRELGQFSDFGDTFGAESVRARVEVRYS